MLERSFSEPFQLSLLGPRRRESVLRWEQHWIGWWFPPPPRDVVLLSSSRAFGSECSTVVNNLWEHHSRTDTSLARLQHHNIYLVWGSEKKVRKTRTRNVRVFFRSTLTFSFCILKISNSGCCSSSTNLNFGSCFFRSLCPCFRSFFFKRVP